MMQGTEKVIFTGCHLGKQKTALTSPSVISATPQKLFDEQN